ncbi:alpha/beta hydrolase fold domain-containing protein [Catellatospora aurea]|uniref:Alpha/beta hydrolase fold domain-containing protein n=1 Tax=Catellatospora aurea TaxID=1337874 RepID=A0ABW2H462_9ACTN
MTGYPPPEPRPTVTFADCTVAVVPGYRPLHLDLHLPPGDGPFPVLLWVHGGGWLEGSRVGLPPTVAPHRFHQRFLDRGWAVADVDYRLALEAQYPAQLLDVQSAVRWLRLHADQLKIDSARFAALGESAGGHLAAMAGLTGVGETAIQAVVNWYGAVDLLAVHDLDDPAAPPAMLFGGPLSGRREFVAFGNPLSRVHAGAPPFLTVHGTDDQIVPASQGQALTEALRAVGVRADLVLVPGADHCFEGYDDIGGLIEQGIDFLDEVLPGR